MSDQDDFAEIVARAQRVNKDMGGLFGAAPGNVAFEPRRNALAAPAMDYEAHCDVFCLPPDKDGYEEVLNLCLRGEAILRWERDSFSKEGDFMVAVCYLTPSAAPARPQAEPEAGQAEQAVRPRKLP